jgi:hypothetical protein
MLLALWPQNVCYGIRMRGGRQLVRSLHRQRERILSLMDPVSRTQARLPAHIVPTLGPLADRATDLRLLHRSPA